MSEEAQQTRTKIIPWLGLGIIILIGAFLRFYQLGAYSIGNAYYAATVKSMLTSWHNFFYAAFEPGGSVSVDKPPLGFWLQALSAYFLGVNGFSLALPQALAGVFSIPLLYSLVKRPFGVWVGLLAALVLALTPVTIAAERNNTIDGTLVLVLLLAAWAVLKSIRTAKLRYLLLSAALLGLGFNIKMLQAYMALPAIFGIYFLCAPYPWWKRLLHWVPATALMLAISLAWVLAVDLTPAADRPYVGSSTDNSMLELIIGHNGLQRLGLSAAALTGAQDGDAPAAGFERPQSAPPLMGAMPGSAPSSDYQQPPQGPAGPYDQGGPMGQGGPQNPGQSGGAFGNEVGQAGITRLFTQPLARQVSWLLPFALLGSILVLAVVARKGLGDEKVRSLSFWVLWLLPMALYFSFTTGLWHAYYLIMLAPAIAALTAITAWALSRVFSQRHGLGWALTACLTAVTLAFEILTFRQYPQYAVTVALVSVVCWLIGVALLAWKTGRTWSVCLAGAFLCISLLISPLLMSALTVFNTHPEVALPNAGPDTHSNEAPAVNELLTGSEKIVLDYLLANTAPGDYLLATMSSHQASPYILATGRPVLTLGGFNGSDDVINLEQLTTMINTGKLRFILGDQQLFRQKAEIGNWVTQNCSMVNLGNGTLTSRDQPTAAPGDRGTAADLYDCAQ